MAEARAGVMVDQVAAGWVCKWVAVRAE